MADPRSDSLRHLRFVHFALIAASFAVLLVSSLQPPSRVAAALAQATALHEASEAIINRADALHAKTCTESLETMLGRYEASSPMLDRPQRVGYDVRLTAVDEQLLAEPLDVYRARGTRRLGDLAAIWNAFDAAARQSMITGVSDLAGLYSVRTVHQPPRTSDAYPTQENEQMLLSPGRFDGPNLEPGSVVEAEVRRVDDGRVAGFELMVRRMQFQEAETGALWDVWFDEPLVAEVTTAPVGDVLATLNDELGLAPATGSFEVSFPALAAVADGLESVELGALVNHLSRRAGEERRAVDLLVGTMRVDTLRTWAAVLLCLLQIYFALHLTQHRHDVVAALDEGTFAWIGAYRAFAPQLVTITTSIVLPAGVVVYIVATGAASASRSASAMSWIIAATSVVAAGATFACFVRVHRQAEADGRLGG